MEYRITFPCLRIICQQFFDLQACKQFLFSFPISLQCREQQTLSKSSGATKEIGFSLLPLFSYDRSRFFCNSCCPVR